MGLNINSGGKTNISFDDLNEEIIKKNTGNPDHKIIIIKIIYLVIFINILLSMI